MKGADKSFGQIKKDQMGREGDLYSKLQAEYGEYGSLETFEADSAVRRNELLFKITTDIEDTRNALKQAEQLTERIRRRLNELEGMYRILTKK
ncbi:MAG: hypothetical protein FJ005_01975 [Chloroflexi bacterium]|jgi:hypothetical protein|nr:hypothetical protein [Chloroflexota bacterium]MCX6009360.1 hypothetical protein [Chloroflexota bacterium]